MGTQSRGSAALFSCKTRGDRREGAAAATPMSAENKDSLRYIVDVRGEFTNSTTKHVESLLL